MQELLRTWGVQRRVWGAVFMREIQTRWGRRNLGFAWLFAEPLVFAFPVMAMWSLMRAPVEHGIPLLTMIWSGYMPLLIFRHVAGRAVYVVRQNAALLYHRQVTPLDIFIGRCGLEAIGNVAALAFSFLVLYFFGFIEWPVDPFIFMVGVIYMVWWSLSVSLVVAAWSERSEIVEHVWQVISYMYMPICGGWFLLDWLPTSIRNVAMAVMPSVHSYEMIRAGLLGNRIHTYFDVTYVSYYLAIITLCGLWMMRGVRRHLELVE